MRAKKIVSFFILLFCMNLMWGLVEAAEKVLPKYRILVVSSYHPGYLWSTETHNGFCDAMLQFGYLDSRDQVDVYTRDDGVASSRAVVKKLWMDSKRKNNKAEKEKMGLQIYVKAKAFEPDLIFLGDDNAAEFIGRKFLDTRVPLVFWGLNNSPLKYGLVDSVERPDHNVTGVYQAGYYVESLQLLKSIVPGARTFAALSDVTTTGRSHVKKLAFLSRKGLLPFQMIQSVSTKNFEEWKSKALELQERVDAFYVAQFSGLEGKNGRPVPDHDIVPWYLKNIRIPEATTGHRVKQGMLCGAVDSGYNQGFEAVSIAHDILAHGAKPGTYPPRAPKRGPLRVNRQRAEMLGITLTENMGIEEVIDGALGQEDIRR
ncbi:MAG: ABC transporter substrate binding protein [Pseudomonadota bacterium]